MTGPEHYLEAERLIALAQNEGPREAAEFGVLLQAAQVHATLAHAAATVDLDDGDIWVEVIR